MTSPTTTAAARRPRYPLLLVLACGAVFGTLVGLALTATAAVPGIVAPGTAVVVGLPLSRALVDLAALTTVGMSFLPTLVGDRARRAAGALALARRIAAVSSAVWLVAALTSLVLEVADYAPGKPVTVAAVVTYVRQLPSGQGLAVVACCALVYLVVAVLAVRRGETVPVELRITVAMFALLPLPVTGHAAMDAAGWRDVTMISMELHVVGAVCWTGGLLAVLLLLANQRDALADALPRFSRLATVCVCVVAVTGAYNGWFELYATPGVHWYVALFTTGYGWILIGKLTCVLAAGALGGYTRFRLLPRIVQRRATAVLTWATLETAVLGVAFGLAAVLVRAPVVSG
ncbi:MAG TPA: CopD family protein [Pseudonocardiaceae bacterium]